MTTLTFLGSSDDIIEVDLRGGGRLKLKDRNGGKREGPSEEFYVLGDGSAEFIVYDHGVPALAVFGRYGEHSGAWGFGVAPVDEDTVIPEDITVSLRQSPTSSYSMELTIEGLGSKVKIVELDN
jgi:hypothetical protein